MCGIVGVLQASGRELPAAPRRAAAVAALAHRGPDDAGEWADEGAGVWLGHRRLAVVELSAAGAQPMVSACGRYVLSYNGELYNTQALRQRLLDAGLKLRGSADTEVLLETFARDGIEDTLTAVDGMFALALWDRAEHSLVLARDRFGEKPLYYGVSDGRLVFASELKGIVALLGAAPVVDPAVLELYLRYAYVPEPHAIFAGFAKLEPGCWLELGPRTLPTLPAVRRYWSLGGVAAQAGSRPCSDDEAMTRVGACLGDAVRRRMLADVPLGAFLSGGIDSSLMVALMCEHARDPVRTYSIGFEQPEYDESPQAAAVARHLGTAHASHVVTAAEAQATIPTLAQVYDEPFADSSQIPTMLVSRFARSEVTVVISGDGGDEIFGGYVRYHAGLSAWQAMQRLPRGVRRMCCHALLAVRPAQWDRCVALLRPLLPQRLAFNTPGDRLHKLAAAGLADDLGEMYRRLISICPAPALLLAAPCGKLDERPALDAAGSDDPVLAMMVLDALHYLPGDVLAKVDRAAMAVGLETRVPFLDPAVVETAWQLPARMRVRDGSGKWVLRKLLARHLPEGLFARPKMGFGVPLDAWLRGPLREWAGDLLSPARLRAAGHFDAAAVEALWREHQSGRFNRQHVLWSLLMFESWREHWQATVAGA